MATETTEDGYGGDLLVFGGDLNFTDSATSGGEDFRSWYRALNGDLGGQHGYRDAVYAACQASADPGGCRARNWTIGGDRRIDFLFARTGAGAMPAVAAVQEPTFNEGDQADLHFTGTDRQDHGYSDHRAVQARIHYVP